MRRLFNVSHIDTIYAQADRASALTAAEGQIRDLLRRRHRLEGKPDDFTGQNQAVLLKTERQTAQAMTLLIGSVADISLLVGGLGILAVMLISVRERMREIGLRRAVGACRRDIWLQFMLESALLSGAGGLIGALGGIAVIWAAAKLGFGEAIISWPAVTAGFAFSVSLGVIFGVYPAQGAANLEPIAALRTE